MRKINISKIERIKRIAVSFAISVGIVVLMQLIFGIYFATDDDYGMASNAFNYRSANAGEHLVFVNNVIGKIVRWLYNITSNINWYSVLMIMFFVMAFTVLCYVFWQLRDSIIGIFPIALIEILIIHYFSFTVVGYLLTITSFVFGAYYLTRDEEKPRIKTILASLIFIVLLLFGFMYRTSAFYSALILVVPLVIYCRKRINVKVVIVLAVAIVAVITAGLFNRELRYSNNEWKEYYKYLESRNLIDESKIDFNQHKNEFKKLNLSKNDVDCLYAWTYADKDVFSANNLKKISSMNSAKEKYLLNIKDVIMIMLKTVSNWIILFIGLIGIIVTNKRGKTYIIFSSLLIYGMTLLLVIKQRLITRVYLPICFVGIIILLFFIVNNYQKEKRKYEVAILILLTVCVGVLSYKKYTGWPYHNYKVNDINNYIKTNKDKLFIMPANTQTRVKYWNHTVFDIPSSSNNISSLGDCGLYSPIYYSKMRDHKVTNKDRLMISMAKDKNIYYIVDKDKLSYQKVIYDQVDKYVKEHTGKKLEYKMIKEFPDCNIKIYQLSLK